MSFDPSSLTVKKAKAKLDGLSDDELSEVYNVELEGKGRTALLDAITSARDDIREVSSMLAEPSVADMLADFSPDDLEPEPAKEEPVEIGIDQFMRLSLHDRKKWFHIRQNVFRLIT